jgi:mono/diheme cytochrome c family protein
LKVARESLRLENEAAEAGEQEVLNVAERDVSHAVMDQFAPNIDDVLIDLEANTVEQIDVAATGAAADEEAAIQAEEAAVDEAIDETIEAADIAIL